MLSTTPHAFMIVKHAKKRRLTVNNTLGVGPLASAAANRHTHHGVTLTKIQNKKKGRPERYFEVKNKIGTDNSQSHGPFSTAQKQRATCHSLQFGHITPLKKRTAPQKQPASHQAPTAVTTCHNSVPIPTRAKKKSMAGLSRANIAPCIIQAKFQPNPITSEATVCYNTNKPTLGSHQYALYNCCRHDTVAL